MTSALEDFKAARKESDMKVISEETKTLYKELNKNVYLPAKKLECFVTCANLKATVRSEGWFGKLVSKLDCPILESLAVEGKLDEYALEPLVSG